MDADGYPEDRELDRIEEWPFEDLVGLFAFLRERWMYGDCGYFATEDTVDDGGYPVIRYSISTAGWSGNESLIRALRKNAFVWTFAWVQSRRGGHHIFEIKCFDKA